MITRRNFLHAGTALLAGATLRPQLARGSSESGGSRLTLPTPGQLAWQDYEVGVIFHLDLPLAAGAKHTLANLERPQLLFDDTGHPIALYAAAGEQDRRAQG